MTVFNRTAFAGRALPALALGVTLGMIGSSAAWAQGMDPVAATGRANRAAASAEKAPMQPPDALPGAKPREPAAPSTRVAADMQPTDALFDAINRGDIASARDALSRGADLNGVNILGMTPMELSVDLGRNDISFLLLSMRGEDSGRGSRATGRDIPLTDNSVVAGKPGAKGKAATSRVAESKSARVAPAAVAVRPATPKLFANDGGTPVPGAGFLGFDSRSASN